jgi:hypothetical protein
MAQKLSLADRLLAKLGKLGVSQRKAKELAKGLAPTAARQTVSGTVTGKLEARLLKLGLTERKAKELAKGLAPLVRASIKGKVKKAAKTLDDVSDQDVNETVDEAVDEAEDAELDKVAPRVNGHRVRLDLPVVTRSQWQHAPTKGVELLRVMDGLSTSRTYLVASVKSETGIVAVRQLNSDWYNVKFYPTMAFWNKTRQELTDLGGQDFLSREWYERCHCSPRALERVLGQLEIDGKPKSRMTRLIDRFKTVAAKPLIRAFDYLHKRVSTAA